MNFLRGVTGNVLILDAFLVVGTRMVGPTIPNSDRNWLLHLMFDVGEWKSMIILQRI